MATRRETNPSRWHIVASILWVIAGMAMMTQPQAASRQPGVANPCAGWSVLLDMLDRPTVGDSPCVVQPDQVVLEAGWARYTLFNQPGYALGYPQLELRIGLPHQNELVFLPPNISHAVMPIPGAGSETVSGGSASIIGIKHEFGYDARWIWAGETLVTVPSGSPTYGAAATGYAINGIVGYNVTSAVALSLMLGVTHMATAPQVQPGAYYWSVNPDLVLTWQTSQRFQLYLETYGQTHTGPGQGAGYNADGGVQYLVTRTFEVDAEVGQRISGNLGGWSRYFGVGFGLMF